MTSRTIVMAAAVLATVASGAENGGRSRISEDWGHKKTVHVDEDTTPRKARVVVLPATIGADCKSKFIAQIKPTTSIGDNSKIFENPSFTTFLIDALVNTRKLDILERERLVAIADELDFSESDYVDPKKVARLGKVLNADYVVISEIRNFSLEHRNKTIPYIGKRRSERVARIATAVRVVDVRTSKIVSSNIADYEHVRRDSGDAPFSEADLQDTLTVVYRQCSKAEASLVVDYAYPIRILKVTGDQLTINRGTGAVVRGEHLAVYERGELMVDPDTKDAMGYDEARVGRAIIRTISGKTAVATLTSSDAPIKVGYICRRVEAPKPTPSDNPPPKLD